MTDDEAEDRVREYLGAKPRWQPRPTPPPAAVCELVAVSAFTRGLLLATAGWLRRSPATEDVADWLASECDAAGRREAAAVARAAK